MKEINKEYKQLYSGIREELKGMHAIDAHSHIMSEDAWLAQGEDFTTLLGYCFTDLVNAGLSKDKWPFPIGMDDRWNMDYGYDLLPDERSAEKKWEMIKPYWQYIRNMGSGLRTRKALSMFFDCDDLTDETVQTVQQKLATFRKKGAYEKLAEEYKIDKILNVVMDIKDNPASSLMAPLQYTCVFSAIQNRRGVCRVEQASNQDVYSLETYIKAVDTILERAVQEGLAGIKWHIMPYLRDTDYDIANTYDAAKIFDRILLMPARGGIGSAVAVGWDEMRPFQDLMQNHLVQFGIEHNLPIQIHAATLGGNYGGPIQNGRPTLLYKLFLRYPQAKFDILHGGYPYSRELGSLAHLFDNVFINCSWLDILSPQAFKYFVKDWLEAIPLNKLFAFGADEFGIFLTCAGIEMVKDFLAEIFTELIAEGRLAEKDVSFIADTILRKNAALHWNLEK